MTPPFFDIPLRDRPKGNPKKGQYLRIADRNSDKFIHPGFRPKGSGGLKRPLREYVIEHIVETAPGHIREALDRVKV